MPCMKKLALALPNLASHLKPEHSAVASAFAPSVIGAVAFTAIMAVITMQFLKNQSWFLWATLTASALQCAGFIATAIYEHDGQNHLAFLASFTTITCAPLLLSIAIFTTFGRLAESVVPEHLKQSRSAWVYVSQRVGTFALLPSLVPVAMFASAIFHVSKFLSPTPIEGRSGAFMRLLNYELGVSQLEKAYMAQAVICLAFAVLVSVFTVKSKDLEVEEPTACNQNWRELLHTINLVNAITLIRTIYKLYESREIVASRTSLGANGWAFWVFDVLPMLAALVVFCAVKPTTYLPRHLPSIVLDPEAPYVDEKGITDYSGTSF